MTESASHHSKSLPAVFVAMLVAHGALLMVSRRFDPVVQSEALPAIQLQAFTSLASAPFRPGLPSATPAPARPAAAKPKSFSAAASPVAQTAAPTTTTESTAPASGSGGVASSTSAAGQMAAGDLRQIYLSELRAHLERAKLYPTQARRLGQTGTVEVTFRVTAEGKIEDARVTRPSPFKRLNDSALATVEALKKFRPLPQEFGSEPLLVALPINYKIHQ